MPLIPASIRALCFDAVGTLLFPDPPAHLVYAEAGKAFGSKLAPAAIRERFHRAFDAEERIDREAGWRTNEEREERRWRRIVARVLDDVSDPEGCFHRLYEHFSRPSAWRLAPHAGEVLEQLGHRGYALALASNYDKRLRAVTAGIPELGALPNLFISSEIGWRKPAPDFFAAISERLSLPPAQILFLGDDPVNDFQGARAAGFHALLFDPSGESKSQPDGIRDLQQLL